MSTEHDSLDGFIAEFIARQPMFFVATAAADGRVNVSPKGGEGTLVVLDDRRVAYLDLTGSGAETIAHVRQLDRITLMWCAFEGPPMIARVHGTATVVTRDQPVWAEMAALFPDKPGARAIVVVTAERISDSCGMSVPLMTYERDRDELDRWARGKGDEGLREYRERKNAVSLDGLPALAPHERA
ncbi:pyridoxamine 5'-phosphate oxidase family protein [Demequina sp. NBRC 110056]|uniref:pyridoxamine 5'-phosphate oxidase family protein n=1 Tax=Demequina sp. NBRC 110056 TaxID=1570345 RepID=UPI000A068D08|nr:pyridoxamine 5'-phosphate oxidase family protein [Demequina sp. NBRC 110056]